MSQDENPFDSRRLPIIFIVAGVIVLGGFSGAIGVGGGGVAGVCTGTNMVCNAQIRFITSVFGNDTSLTVGKVTTGVWNAVQNQTMIVIPSVGASTLPTQVLSVTDTLGDGFTRQLIQQAPGSPEQGNELEIWSGVVLTSGLNAVTANWNLTTNPLILQTLVYSGVAGFGARNSTFASAVPSPPVLTLKTQKSGSWILGGLAVAFPGTCTIITTSPSFTKRSDICSQSAGVFVGETEVSDNATALRNTFKLTYAPTFTPQPGQLVDAIIELVATDSEPSTPDFANFCTVSPFNCPTVINAVSLNTNPSALNKGLAQGTAFCTGITTKPLTTVGNKIFVWAAYSADDLNTTNAKIFIQLYVSANAPTTTFSSGLCATGGSIVATGSIFFSLTGALSLTNTFSTALNGVDTIVGGNPAGGTYYGWLEVTAQNVPVGSLGMDQLCSNVSFGLCSLQMIEIK